MSTGNGNGSNELKQQRRQRPPIPARIISSDINTLEPLDSSTPTHNGGRSNGDYDGRSQTPTNGKGLRSAGAVLRKMNHGGAAMVDDFASPNVAVARSGIPVMASSSLSNGQAAAAPLPTPSGITVKKSKTVGSHKGRDRGDRDRHNEDTRSNVSGTRSPVSPDRGGQGDSPPTSLPQSPSPDSPTHQHRGSNGGAPNGAQQRRGSNAPNHFVWPDPEQHPPGTASGADTHSEVIAPGRVLGLQRTRPRHGDENGEFYEPESPSPGPMMMMQSASSRSLAELPLHPPPLQHSQSESGLRYSHSHNNHVGPSSRTGLLASGLNPSHPHRAALTNHERSGSFMDSSASSAAVKSSMIGGSQTPQPGHTHGDNFKKARMGSIDLTNAPIPMNMGRRGSHSHARGPPRSLPALNNAPAVLTSVPSTPTHSSSRGARPELEPLHTPKRANGGRRGSIDSNRSFAADPPLPPTMGNSPSSLGSSPLNTNGDGDFESTNHISSTSTSGSGNKRHGSMSESSPSHATSAFGPPPPHPHTNGHHSNNHHNQHNNNNSSNNNMDEPDIESEKPRVRAPLRGSLVTPQTLLSSPSHHNSMNNAAPSHPPGGLPLPNIPPSVTTVPHNPVSSTLNSSPSSAAITANTTVPLVPRQGALVGNGPASNQATGGAVHPSLTGAHSGAGGHLLSPSYTPIKTATPSRIPVPARTNPILSPLQPHRSGPGVGGGGKRDPLASPPSHGHHLGDNMNLGGSHSDRSIATAPPRHIGDDDADHSARATSAAPSLPGGSSVGGRALLSPHHHHQTQSARQNGVHGGAVGGHYQPPATAAPAGSYLSHSARSASPPKHGGNTGQVKMLRPAPSSSDAGYATDRDGSHGGSFTIGGDDAERLVLHWPKMDHDDDGPPPPVPITRLNTELAARMTNSVVGTIVSSHRGEIGIMISGRGDISGRQPAMVSASARGTVGPDQFAAMLNSARGTFRSTAGGDVSARGAMPPLMGDLSARGVNPNGPNSGANPNFGLKISVDGVTQDSIPHFQDSYRGPPGFSLQLDINAGPATIVTPRPGTSLDSARLFIGAPLNVSLNEKRHSFVVSGDSLLLSDGFDINARGVVNVPYLPRSEPTPIPSPALSARGLPSGREPQSGRESGRDHHLMSSGRHAHSKDDSSPSDEVGEGKMVSLDSSPGSKKRSGGYRLSKKRSTKFNFPQDGGFLTIVQSRNTLEVPSPNARARRVTQHRQAKLGRNVGALDLERIGQLGHGQHGFVFKAIHKPSNTFCALKYTNIYEHDKRHQMRNELEAFSKINNPHIVNFMGAYFDAENVVTVLEYMNRGSLRSGVDKVGPLSEETCKNVARQILLGLDHLHSRFLIHRDLKPENILINNFGDVKVSDFGTLMQLEGADSHINLAAGTIQFLAPERVQRGSFFSFPADIWSFGITIIFCATGGIPLPENYWSLVTLLTMKAPPNLPPGADFSPAFRDFVASALMTDPSRRGTAQSLLKHPWLTGRPLAEAHRPHPGTTNGLSVSLPSGASASPVSTPSSANSSASPSSSPASSTSTSASSSSSTPSSTFGSAGASAPPPDPSAAYVSSYKPPPPNVPHMDSEEQTGWKPVPAGAPAIPHIALESQNGRHSHSGAIGAKPPHQRRPSMMREPSSRLLEQGSAYVSPRPQLVRFYWDQQTQGWKERVLTDEEKAKWAPQETLDEGIEEGIEEDGEGDDAKEATSQNAAVASSPSKKGSKKSPSDEKSGDGEGDDEDEKDSEPWPFAEPTHQDLADWDLISDHVIKKEYPRGICHFNAKDHALFEHIADTLGFPPDVTEEAFKRKLKARREEEKKEEEALAANGGVKAPPTTWKKPKEAPAPILGGKGGGMLQLTLPTDANNRDEEQLISLKLPSAITGGGMVSLQLIDDFGGYPLTMPVPEDPRASMGHITMLPMGPISPHQLALPQISIISPGGLHSERAGVTNGGGFLGEALSARKLAAAAAAAAAAGGNAASSPPAAGVPPMGSSFASDLAARRAREAANSGSSGSSNNTSGSNSGTSSGTVTPPNHENVVLSSVPLRLHESTSDGGAGASTDPFAAARRGHVRGASFANLDIGAIKAKTAATAAGLTTVSASSTATTDDTATTVGRVRPEANTIEY